MANTAAGARAARLNPRVVRRLAFGLALAALLVLAVIGVLYWEVDTRAQVDKARSADTIIVLGAAVLPGGRAGLSLSARTQHAIALYKAGYASHLILSGGLGRYPPAEAEVMREMASAAGVPADAMVLEDASHSTEENLANSKGLMDAHDWHTALIVSDPFHLFRAEMIAQDLGMEAYGSPASDSPNYTVMYERVYYTTREALALIWYFVTRTFGEPAWLYRLLKGRI
jgi:uncharacterized SAM-binding protein YcdF (DUF218 family)